MKWQHRGFMGKTEKKIPVARCLYQMLGGEGELV